MNNFLDKKLLELNKTLFAQAEVQEYFRLRKALEEDKELMDLDAQIRFHQRKMGENIANDRIYFGEKETYEKLKKEYDSHPLVVNYEIIKSVVYDLLKQVKDIIE